MPSEHYLALWDTRLAGNVTRASNMTLFSVDQTTSLSLAFNVIKSAARQKGRKGKIHTLFLLCHGFAGSNASAQQSGDFGGSGLQIGRENLIHSNVSLWSAIKSKCSNIVVYACAAGDTEPGNEGTNSDGKYLMGALAVHSQSFVFASNRIQYYNGGSNSAPIAFGAWEGEVSVFDPAGSGSRQVSAPDVEISDVYAGTAP